jgi:hypothetical protein
MRSHKYTPFFRLGNFDTDLIRLARPCWRKQRHLSYGAAAAQLRSLDRRGFLRPEENARVYFCKFCQSYHVGRLTKLAPATEASK